LKLFFYLLFPAAIIIASTGCNRDYDEQLKIAAVKDGNAIWIMNEDGSKPLAVTNTTDDGICTEPSWSVDYNTIVYISDSTKLCLMNSDGSNKRVIYTGGSTIINPAFYPDGINIAFGENTNVYTYNTKTGSTSLLHASTGVVCFISIAGDGRISVLNNSGWDITNQVTAGLQILTSRPTGARHGAPKGVSLLTDIQDQDTL